MLSAIKLRFSARLRNKLFRRKFFRLSAQEEVAQQIRELRLKREMRQVDLAKACHMKQSAVSRLEQANYSRWTFTTLQRVAESLDARVRVILQPADEVIAEYERQDAQEEELARNFNQSFREVPLAAQLNGQGVIAQTAVSVVRNAERGSVVETDRSKLATNGNRIAGVLAQDSQASIGL